MKEIWETPFGNAVLKIERANKHIADIEERLRISSDTYGPSLHMDIKTGKQFLYYGLTDRTLRSDIALLVGDAVHNLYSALDIAWCAMLPKVTAYSKFPVYSKKTREDFEATLKGKDIPTPLLTLMVDSVKPYKGGDNDILTLHDLDIDDKHVLLIPMLTIVGVTGVELEHEDGSTARYDIVLTRPNYYRQPLRQHAKFKNHGEVRFKVEFREGTPLEGIEVIPTLRRYSAKVNIIVRTLQRMK